VIARLGEKGQQLNELGSQLLGELGKIIGSSSISLCFFLAAGQSVVSIFPARS
jgi:hypothetical protein